MSKAFQWKIGFLSSVLRLPFAEKPHTLLAVLYHIVPEMRSSLKLHWRWRDQRGTELSFWRVITASLCDNVLSLIKKNYIYIYQFPILLWKDQISTATNLIFQKSFLCLFGFHLTFNFFKVTSGISKKEACGNLKVFHLQFQICFAPQGKFHLPWMLLRTFLKSTAKYNSVSFFFLLFFVGFFLRDQSVRAVSGIHLLEFIIS